MKSIPPCAERMQHKRRKPPQNSRLNTLEKALPKSTNTTYDHNNAKNEWIQAQYKVIEAKYDYVLKTKILNL